MKITYYIWSNNELLGSVNELNLKSAMQKAAIVARYSGAKKFELTTTCTPSNVILTTGRIAEINRNPVSKWQNISKILSGSMEIRQ